MTDTTHDTADAYPRLIRCPLCEAVNIDTGDAIVCRRCRTPIYPYPHVGIQRAIAWLLTAVILYILANLYPVLAVKTLFGYTQNTIVGGIIALWDQGSYLVAVVLLVASVVIPILKFVVLLYLLISLRYPVASSASMRHRIHAVIETIGPWSMIDVFVVTVLTGLVKYSSFRIMAGPGATAFVLMVAMTMLATRALDPRLIELYSSKES